MRRIVVRPDDLRHLSGSLRQAAIQVRALASHANGLVAGLDWEVRGQVAVEEQTGLVRHLAVELTGQAESMATMLASRADLFEAADRQGLVEVMAGLEAQAAAAGAAVQAAPDAPPAPSDGAAPPTGPMMLGHVDLAAHFSPAQAAALRYTLAREGVGFTTCHGSVNYERNPGERVWDATLLNYGIISFAFPVGGGYGLMNRLVSDPQAQADLARLFPQHISEPDLQQGFVEAFTSGEESAVAWWKAHGMADEHHVKPEWQRLLKDWAGTARNQEIQVEQVANRYMATAAAWAERYGIRSERGLSFLFDVSVQEGWSYVKSWDAMKGTEGWADLSDQQKLSRMLESISTVDSRKRKSLIVNGGETFEAEWGLSYDRPWKQ